MMTYPPWIVGVDLGKLSDPTALAIARRELHTWGETTEQRYLVQHLERMALGTAYPTVVAHVADLLARLPRPREWERKNWERMLLPENSARLAPWYTLVIDATGVGEGVCDLFTLAHIPHIRVTLTAGLSTTEPTRDRWHVPRQSLIGALVVAIQDQRLHVASALPDAGVLVKEAQNFQYKVTGKGAEEYTLWRESKHDDLVFATALVVWWGEHTRPIQRSADQPTHAQGMGNPFAQQYRRKHAIS